LCLEVLPESRHPAYRKQITALKKAKADKEAHGLAGFTAMLARVPVAWRSAT